MPSTRDGFVDAFLRAPLFSTAYAHGFGTLYTGGLRRDGRRSRGSAGRARAWELPLAGFAPARAHRGAGGVRAHADARLMRTAELRVRTGDRLVTDLSAEVRAFAGEAGGDGLLHVFVPHATAGVALLETGSGSEADLADAVARLVPRDARYVHAHGSAGHGGDHVLPAFVAPSLDPCRWSRASHSSASGSRSCWWTRTWTTRTAPCG